MTSLWLGRARSARGGSRDGTWGGGGGDVRPAAEETPRRRAVRSGLAGEDEGDRDGLVPGRLGPVEPEQLLDLVVEPAAGGRAAVGEHQPVGAGADEVPVVGLGAAVGDTALEGVVTKAELARAFRHGHVGGELPASVGELLHDELVAADERALEVLAALRGDV